MNTFVGNISGSFEKQILHVADSIVLEDFLFSSIYARTCHFKILYVTVRFLVLFFGAKWNYISGCCSKIHVIAGVSFTRRKRIRPLMSLQDA